MLLAGVLEFNMDFRTNIGNALLGGLMTALVAAPASADEIRRWRGADGRLHVEIIGSEGPVDPDEIDLPRVSVTELTPEEKFSIEASTRRRKIEKELNESAGALARTRAELEETRARELLAYAPGTATDAASAQLAIDAQKNAFLAVQQFRQEKSDDLRRLRRAEREILVEIRGLWEAFETLREEVRERHGRLPSWWRDRLDCPACPSAVEIEAALAPRASKKSSEPAAQP